MRTYRDQTDASSTDFLRRLNKAATMHIKTILTDNGSPFTDRFTSKKKTPSLLASKPAFDLLCAEFIIA